MLTPWEWLAVAGGALIVLWQWLEDWRESEDRLDTLSRNNRHYRHHWR